MGIGLALEWRHMFWFSLRLKRDVTHEERSKTTQLRKGSQRLLRAKFCGTCSSSQVSRKQRLSEMDGELVMKSSHDFALYASFYRKSMQILASLLPKMSIFEKYFDKNWMSRQEFLHMHKVGRRLTGGGGDNSV